jgi:phosphoglycolate phosphatase-like HAD superfamily hydrolase
MAIRDWASQSVAVLFDLDGVIIDTRRAIVRALLAVAVSELGRQVAPLESELERYATDPPPAVLAALGVAEARAVYDRSFDAALAAAIGELRVFSPVVAGIGALADRGVKVGVVTRQAERRLPMLVPAAVAARLDVVIAHEHAPPKPAPDGILLALRRMEVPPSRAMFVGDTAHDVLAARAAGVRSVAVTWGFTSEQILVQSRPDAVLTAPEQVGPGLLRLLGLWSHPAT